MTTYVGETLLLSHTATFDGTALDDTNTESVEIAIYNTDYTETVQAAVAMIWNGTDERWEYWWDTTGLDAGTYRCRVTVTTTDGENWEYFKLALKADPLGA